MDYVDLHTHSVYSDGTKTVEEIVELCIEKNIKILSLTDHDCINGLREISSFATSNNIRFINGIELSAIYNNEEIHVLAYGFDINDKTLSNFLNETVILRKKRNDLMFEKLFDNGIKINTNNLVDTKDSVITRGDIAQEIVKQGYCQTNQEVFTKYLSKGCSCFVEKEGFSYKEVFDVINQMNALSSLAHPKIYSFYNNLKTHISELKRNGLDSIECYHNSHSLNDTNNLLGYSNRFDLLKTAGSDYHGDKKQNVFLGETTNHMFIEKNMVIDFLNKIDTL